MNIDLEALAEKIMRNQRLTKEERLAALYNPSVCHVSGPAIRGRPGSPSPYQSAAGRPSFGGYYYPGRTLSPSQTRPEAHSPQQPYQPYQPFYPPYSPSSGYQRPASPINYPGYAHSPEPPHAPYSPPYGGAHHDPYPGAGSLPHGPYGGSSGPAPIHGGPAGHQAPTPSTPPHIPAPPPPSHGPAPSAPPHGLAPLVPSTPPHGSSTPHGPVPPHGSAPSHGTLAGHPGAPTGYHVPAAPHGAAHPHSGLPDHHATTPDHHLTHPAAAQGHHLPPHGAAHDPHSPHGATAQGHNLAHHDDDTHSEGAHSAHPDQPKIKPPKGPTKHPFTDPNASIPTKLYGLPASLWDGLQMNGKFVAQSEVGNVALIVTAPHDGLMESKDPKRAKGLSKADSHTMEIALTIYQDVKKALGAPTIVVQLLRRAWVDCNRGTPFSALNLAFDHPDGEHAYHTWHGAVADACAAYKKKGVIPLLLDIHGSANPKLTGQIDPAYGGATGKFIPSLKKTYGDPTTIMQTGPNALLKGFDNNGLPVHKGMDVFDGGYTVKHYSSVLGIDCVQIEFDTKFRANPEAGQQAGHAIAKAVIPFLKQYPCKA